MRSRYSRGRFGRNRLGGGPQGLGESGGKMLGQSMPRVSGGWVLILSRPLREGVVSLWQMASVFVEQARGALSIRKWLQVPPSEPHVCVLAGKGLSVSP